ncbi:hypothetical protein BH09PAT1_BH09PAT1_7740 [soil metagenome]
MKLRKITSLHKGFTLVELLVVLAITGVAGTVLFASLSSTFRGTNKSDSIATLQQNGNFVMAQMSRMVRFASDLQSPNTCYTGSGSPLAPVTSISILNSDNLPTTFAFDTSSGTIASNGANLLNSNAVIGTACSFTCSQTSPYQSPTMSISFTLNKKNTNSLVENNSPITFPSSVNMVNVK